jgi:hypothetical protein
MDRRWGGALVLAVAIIAALVGNARTKQVSGAPVSAPVPDPPSVGDCLLESPGANAWGPVDYGSNDDGQDSRYPELGLGACRDRRFGEIVGLVPDGLDRTMDTGDPWSDPNSPLQDCYSDLSSYVGASDTAADPVQWSPIPSTGLILVGPSAVQRAAGQRWLACVASGVNAATGQGASYRGSVRDVYRTLRFPPELAQCVDQVPSTAGNTLVDCHQRHAAEMLGILFSDRPLSIDAAALARECTELARSMTGLKDITAGGRLRVGSIPTDLPPDSGAADPASSSPQQWFCVLTPTKGRALTGPLLGLGDGPVPVR